MSILQDIYNENYFPSEPIEKMPKKLRSKKIAFYDEVERALGEEFLTRHWAGLCDAEQFQDYANFREGFRLGVSLMMELL